jgi:hypothetical protein
VILSDNRGQNHSSHHFNNSLPRSPHCPVDFRADERADERTDECTDERSDERADERATSAPTSAPTHATTPSSSSQEYGSLIVIVLAIVVGACIAI